MYSHLTINKYTLSNTNVKNDFVAIEDTLQISLVYKNKKVPYSTTMCTLEDKCVYLGIGLLFDEGIISDTNDIKDYEYNNKEVIIKLRDKVDISLEKFNRSMYMSSSCGNCGKTTIQDIIQRVPKYKIDKNKKTLDIQSLLFFQDTFNTNQPTFAKTGGTHASGIFSKNDFIIREDVGRHNALDKVIGEAFMEHKLPLSDYVLYLSGRISFELVQKAANAGIPYIVAFGAPSSMAIQIANKYDITLIGFCKTNSCNIYTHKEHIKGI